jgi:hypothetical protein
MLRLNRDFPALFRGRRGFWNFLLRPSRCRVAVLWLSGNFPALFGRRRRFGNFLLWPSRCDVAMLRLGGLNFIPPRWRQSALLRGLRPLVWLGLRFIRPHPVAALLLGLRLSRRRGWLLLAIFRLLIVSLLFPACGRGRCLASRLIVGALLVLPQITTLIVVIVASRVIGLTRFTDDVPHRTRGDIAPGRATNRLNAGSAILKHRSLTPIDFNRPPVEIINHACAIDDRSIVDLKIASAAEVILETMHIAKGEERSGQHRATRSARRPTDVIVAVAPTHPCWCPFRARYPFYLAGLVST